MNIKQLNLNLLKAFAALYATQNVTYASERMAITQAAMSNALRRLREAFADDLFIRNSRGIVATAKAHELAPQITRILSGVENLFHPVAFAPNRYQGEFTFYLSEYGEHFFLPELFKKINRSAPNLKIIVKPYYENIDEDNFSKNIACLAIGQLQQVPPHFASEKLFEDEAICVLAKNHPWARKKLKLNAYLKAEHIAFHPKQTSTSSYVDNILLKMGVQRNVVLRNSYLCTTLKLIESSHLIGTLPKLLLEKIRLSTKLTECQPPFHIPPCTISLIWHESYTLDPLHTWIRQLIVSIRDASSILSPP